MWLQPLAARRKSSALSCSWGPRSWRIHRGWADIGGRDAPNSRIGIRRKWDSLESAHCGIRAGRCWPAGSGSCLWKFALKLTDWMIDWPNLSAPDWRDLKNDTTTQSWFTSNPSHRLEHSCITSSEVWVSVSLLLPEGVFINEMWRNSCGKLFSF